METGGDLSTVYAALIEHRTMIRSRLADHCRWNPHIPWMLTVGMMRGGDKLASYEVLAKALFELTDEPWQGTTWEPRESLGRWLVLVVAACEGTDRPGQSFWQRQSVIVARLQNDIAADVGDQSGALMSGLGGLQTAVEQLAANEAADRPCADIIRGAGQLVAITGQGAQ